MLQRKNLLAKATYDFMQKNDSDICLRWLGDIGTQKDATCNTAIPIEGLNNELEKFRTIFSRSANCDMLLEIQIKYTAYLETKNI